MNNTKANILSGIFGACVGAVPTSFCILSSAVGPYPVLLSTALFAAAATGIISIGSKGLAELIPPAKAIPILAGAVTFPTVTYGLICALA